MQGRTLKVIFVSFVENHFKFDYSTKKKKSRQRRESTSMLIKCSLSLMLISGLNCVSLRMTRINKLEGGGRNHFSSTTSEEKGNYEDSNG